jgi:hypothetical protein
MSKFLLNLRVQIFKALVYSKIKFYSEKNFFHRFRPSRGPLIFSSLQPVAPPLPNGPRPLGRPISPSRPGRPRAGAALPDCRQSHRKTLPAAPPLPSLRLAGRWTPPIIPHLWLHRARPRRHRLPPLATSPSSTLRMPPELLLAPPSSPLPLNPPLNLAPVFNGVKAINAAITPPGHPSPALPGPGSSRVDPVHDIIH